MTVEATIQVLIVDDHAILRAGLRHVLSGGGDIVVAAEAGNALEALARSRAQAWDAMVLGMSMPGRSAIALIKQIKGENPKLPILALSMDKEDFYALRVLRAGASGYLGKDNAESELASAIRKVAGGGLFISPAVAEKLAVGMLQANRDDAPSHTRLSDREYEVFRYLVAGEGVTNIARKLYLSVKTVSTHKFRIIQKLNLANTAELIYYAIKHGLVAEGGGASA